MAQIKTKAIAYQGINTNNSDYAAVDGELAVCENLICEDGGLKVIPPPQDTGFTPKEKDESVVFIHKNADYEHWIAIKETKAEESAEQTDTIDKFAVYYYSPSVDSKRHDIASALEGTFVQCSAIGNILMLLTGEHPYYFLFNQTNQATYISLGTSLPELDISFTALGYFRSDGDLYQSKADCVVVDSAKVAAATSAQSEQSDSANQTNQTDVGAGFDASPTEQAKSTLRAALPPRPLAMQMESLSYSISKYFSDWPSSDNEIAEVKADETDNAGKNYPQLFTDICFNALNNLILEARQQGLMVMPRLARAAWRMYDGTYAKMTTPVLLFNTGTRHFSALRGKVDVDAEGTSGKNIASTLFPYSLDFLIRNDMDVIRKQWKDIIKGVTIFLGSEIYDYDQNGLVKSLRFINSTVRQYTSGFETDTDNTYTYLAGTRNYHAVLPRIGEGEQLKQVKAGAPFFRAYDLDIEDVMSGKGTPTESASNSDTAANTDAPARYTLLHFSRPLTTSGTITTRILAHSLTLTFSSFGSGSSSSLSIPIYDGDSLDNIYQSVKEAVEALNAPVEVHKMYLTHRRPNNEKKLVDFALGIAIIGKRGPVVLEEITTAEDTETAATTTTTTTTTTTAEPTAEGAEATATAEPTAAAGAYTLNVTGINAYGHPLPSDELPLASLETQTSVQDDYMQHVEILPKYVRAYNSRLCMANLTIRHTPYTLSHLIVPRVAAYRIEYVMYYLRTAEGEAVIKTAYPNEKSLWDTCLHYLYYPDSRCYKALVAAANSQGEVNRYLSFDMEPSSSLNGAVFCDKIPYNDMVVLSDSEGKYYYDLRAQSATEMNGHVADDQSDQSASSAPLTPYQEHQHNVVLSTYVHNPWNWAASGVSEIGSSTILALCPNTMAIEQEQFGKNPLYAFTSDEGVWGLSVGTDGQLVAAQPATRDILLNPDSLLQIDGAILFATRRGIMMLTGRNCTLLTQPLESDEASSSSSVSALPGWDQILTQTHITDKQLPTPGEDIKDFVSGCRMAYDYLNSRIIVYRSDKAYAYVYSLKSKQWGMMLSPGLCRSLNSYPSALCATNDGRIVDLADQANLANQANLADQAQSASVASSGAITVQGLVVSRPLKISDYDTLKTIYSLFQRGKIRPGHVYQALWGSRDLFHWNLLGSSKREFLTGMAGSPYTYFRIAMWGQMATDEIIHRLTLTYREKYLGRQRAANNNE